MNERKEFQQTPIYLYVAGITLVKFLFLLLVDLLFRVSG